MTVRVPDGVGGYRIVDDSHPDYGALVELEQRAIAAADQLDAMRGNTTRTDADRDAMLDLLAQSVATTLRYLAGRVP